MKNDRKDTNDIPGVGAALLPNAACPACRPVYAGMPPSPGSGFLMAGPYFYLFIGILLSIPLFGLMHKVKSRRGYTPFWIGLLSAIIITPGKYYALSECVFYSGVFLLITASIWINIPNKKNASSDKGASIISRPNYKTI